MARLLCFSSIIFVLLGVSHAGEIQIMDCPGVTNKVSDVVVDVSDCPSGQNCTLYKGITYYLTTTFTPNQDFRVANMRTLGIMGNMRVPYMGFNAVCPEATTEDGQNCDPQIGLEAGKAYTHIKDFPVRRSYPEMDMKARVEYFQGTKPTRRALILCYEVPIKIVSSDSENEVEES